MGASCCSELLRSPASAQVAATGESCSGPSSAFSSLLSDGARAPQEQLLSDGTASASATRPRGLSNSETGGAFARADTSDGGTGRCRRSSKSEGAEVQRLRHELRMLEKALDGWKRESAERLSLLEETLERVAASDAGHIQRGLAQPRQEQAEPEPSEVVIVASSRRSPRSEAIAASAILQLRGACEEVALRLVTKETEVGASAEAKADVEDEDGGTDLSMAKLPKPLPEERSETDPLDKSSHVLCISRQGAEVDGPQDEAWIKVCEIKKAAPSVEEDSDTVPTGADLDDQRECVKVWTEVCDLCAEEVRKANESPVRAALKDARVCIEALTSVSDLDAVGVRENFRSFLARAEVKACKIHEEEAGQAAKTPLAADCGEIQNFTPEACEIKQEEAKHASEVPLAAEAEVRGLDAEMAAKVSGDAMRDLESSAGTGSGQRSWDLVLGSCAYPSSTKEARTHFSACISELEGRFSSQAAS